MCLRKWEAPQRKAPVIDHFNLTWSSSTNPGGGDVLVGLQLIGEIRHGYAERLRIVVRTVAGTLLRAERAREVVVSERNVGAVLRV